MQHVMLYYDNLAWRSCSFRQNKFSNFDGTNAIFSNSTGPCSKIRKGGKIPTMRLRIAGVVKVQCMHCKRHVVVVVVVVVDINSPNVGTPRLRVEQIFNVTIRTKVLI